MFEFRDFYKNKFEFRLFLWPRGASAGMDGFLKCSNALFFIRFWGGCGLEASQPVWEGSLSAQMHLF